MKHFLNMCTKGFWLFCYANLVRKYSCAFVDEFEQLFSLWMISAACLLMDGVKAEMRALPFAFPSEWDCAEADWRMLSAAEYLSADEVVSSRSDSNCEAKSDVTINQYEQRTVTSSPISICNKISDESYLLWRLRLLLKWHSKSEKPLKFKMSSLEFPWYHQGNSMTAFVRRSLWMDGPLSLVDGWRLGLLQH